MLICMFSSSIVLKKNILLHFKLVNCYKLKPLNTNSLIYIIHETVTNLLNLNK